MVTSCWTGTHDRVLKNIGNLKVAGVPFGSSSTITSMNVEVFLNTEIYHYFFEEMGATYLWVFHLMHVGRARDSLPLLINSRQRIPCTAYGKRC